MLNNRFDQLIKLDLYSNQLTNIKFRDDIISKCNSLKYVTLSKNDLSALDSFKLKLMFSYIQDLNIDENVLDLCEDSLQKVPALLEQHKNIQINIKSFSFKNSLLDSNIVQLLLPLLNNTQIINLSKNQIQCIPKLNIPTLERLDLSENILNSESSCNIFTSHLPNLKVLNISKNQIDQLFLSESIINIDLNSLEELDCSFNHIQQKSCQLLLTCGKFDNLQRINFRQNKVLSPVDEFQTEIKCGKLVSIILQNNGIETVGAEKLFSSVSNSVKFLDLSFNKIKEKIQLREVGLVNLEGLDLSGNQLGDEGCGEFLKCFELRRLSNLNISMNRMRVVPDQFLLPSLWMLNISGNQSIGIYSKIEEYQNLNYFVKIIL